MTIIFAIGIVACFVLLLVISWWMAAFFVYIQSEGQDSGY